MISIIIPVIRPKKAKRCMDAMMYDPNINSIPCEIVTAEDSQGVGCPAMVKKLTDRARGDMIMFLGDDTIPQPGFLNAAIIAMDKLPDGWGVVGLNTQDDRPGVGFNDHAHWMASKKMLKHIPEANFSARNINTAMATMS